MESKTNKMSYKSTIELTEEEAWQSLFEGLELIKKLPDDERIGLYGALGDILEAVHYHTDHPHHWNNFDIGPLKIKSK
jgi:hypothetical protein